MFNTSIEPKVLLVLPTTDDLVRSKNRSSLAPAYGLNILGTALRNEGLGTIVVDEFILRQILISYNLNSWIEAVEYILNYYKSIKCVGISLLTSFRKTAVQISTVIKKNFPDIIIVWGGPHVTGVGKLLYYKYKSCVDVMVAGVTDFDIIFYLKELILSKWSRRESVFLVGNPTKDISKKIFPDYSQYMGTPVNAVPKIITRTASGCPTSHCVFCGARFLDGEYSAMDHSNAQNEINRLLSYGPKRIEFHDQDLCRDFDRLNKIIPLSNFSSIDESYCHADVNSLTKKHLDFFIKTNVKWDIFIGLESASVEIRHYLGKKMTRNNVANHLIQLNDYVSKSNVRLGLFIMCGVPIEKPCHIQETIELLKKLTNVDICFSFLKVFPGTQIAQNLINEGRIDPNIWLDEDGPPIVNALDDDQLKQTIETWTKMLSLFPFASVHNQIDRMLLNINT